MRERRVVFTRWNTWDARSEIVGVNSPGVYLLAHLPAHKVPKGAASPLDRRIVYIGETHGQTFARRWRQFARSAKTGQRGHAGGRTYHEKYGEVQDNLHVAAFAVEQPEWSERYLCFFIRHVEATLIWRFSRTHNPDRLCNKC